MTCLLLAYLDPGSGSALIGTLFAIVGAIAFSFKSLFYRIILGKKVEKETANETIAIFSEGKSYWGTFRPVVQELLLRKVKFSYYTLDPHDPALLMDDPLMYCRLFDKSGWTWAKKFSAVKAKVMLSTTPNIGCTGYPLPRPDGVEKLAHVFHDPAGVVDHYMKGSLDYYDDVLLVGEGRKESIQIVEKKRGTKAKRFFVCGAPYLDAYVKRLHDGSLKDATFDSKCVLVGSSWGEKSLLRVYGCDFVKDLLDAGYKVIVRPHPHSFSHEPEFIEEVWRKVTAWGAEWDTQPDGMLSMARAAVLVSDTSGIRLDFAYLFNRPVVSMRVARDADSLAIYDGEYLEELYIDSVAKHIGKELGASSDILGAVKDLTAVGSFDISEHRDKNCANFGCAASSVVDYLVREGDSK